MPIDRFLSSRRWRERAVLVVMMSIIAGCGDRSAGPVPEQGATDSNAAKQQSAMAVADEISEGEHGHKSGGHGGLIVSLGQDSYHAEAVVEQDGTLRLFILGADETRIIDVETQTLKGFVRGIEATESQPLLFMAAPQDGDKDGRTSVFTAIIPEDLSGQNVAIAIPSINIDGERFRVAFDTTAVGNKHADEMPNKVADVAERELYLTPAGVYSSDDITANGNVTASAKFKGVKSSHDMFPKTGDRICPITKTKANTDFIWIVGGKPYQFCCPPCVDEFMKLAKSHPDQIADPDTFIKADEKPPSP